MTPGMDPLNIILLVVAIAVFWRLKSMLGTRTGFEKPPLDLRPPKPMTNGRADDNVIPMPSQDNKRSATESIDAAWKGHAEEGSPVALGLAAIAQASPGFSTTTFLAGAKAAYEMILEAYAAGNKQALKPLLSKPVFEGFASAIDQRAKAGETMTFQFVGVHEQSVTAAVLEGRRASITIRFVSDMISATVDKAGVTQSGNPQTVTEKEDVWTFERDVSSRDPNWLLIATDDPDT